MKMNFNKLASIIKQKCLYAFKYVCLTSLFVTSFTACGNNNTTAENSESISIPSIGSENHRIIIDTDTAGDDATAIMLAALAPNISIEGITVLAGNVDIEQAANNALMVVEVSGKEDIPVYKGASSTITGVERDLFSVFGQDGMGDMDLIHPEGKAKEQDAVDFIIDTIKANPDEIEIVALGPATNIAMAIEKDPETMSHVKRIYSMGTAGFGKGNATPVAEFNVYCDAEAYSIMLESDIPITIMGADVCQKEGVTFSQEELEELTAFSSKLF